MGERAPSTDDELSLGLHRLQRLLASRRVFSRLAEASGVELSQQAIQVLRALSEDGPRPVADVARVAHMDLGAVSRQLKTLEDGGLLSRKTSPTHGSIVLVEATAKGKRAARQIEAVRARHLTDALSTWSTAERAELGRLLLRFVDDLQRTPYRAR
jgi:DNA-binding MarR family transcriptional regulator